MAVYNGEKFLRRQLESLSKQETLPDELIVVDDCSTDRTRQLLIEYAAIAPFEVKTYHNMVNLGHELNFGVAIERCSGDIIFLADQDDVWFPEKISVVSEIFENERNVHLVICDAHITDTNLRRSGRTAIQLMKFSRILGERKQGLTLGCATAFTSDLKNLVCPIEKLDFGHDSWIHEIGDVLRVRKVIDKPLQLYRRHSGAATLEDGTVLGSSVGQSPGLTAVWTAGTADVMQVEYAKRLRALELLKARLDGLTGRIFMETLSSRDRNLAQRNLNLTIRSVRLRHDLMCEQNFFNRKLGYIRLLMSGGYAAFVGWRSFVKDFLLR